MKIKDYYKLLNITSDASQVDIRKAYYRKASELHPDKNEGSTEFEKQFIDVSEAYEVLKDAEKRQKYDELVSNEKKQGISSFFEEVTDISEMGNSRKDRFSIKLDDISDFHFDTGFFSDFYRIFFRGPYDNRDTKKNWRDIDHIHYDDLLGR